MLKLNNVTLISICCNNPEGAVDSLLKCINLCSFSKTILITNNKKTYSNNIVTIEIDNISNINEYSEFCIKELHKYFSTSHCLIVQPDSWITNPAIWTDEFLHYDYIGAPWPIPLLDRLMKNLTINKGLNGHDIGFDCNLPSYDPNHYRIGNGGFSLRSLRLQKLLSKIGDKYKNTAEDNIISIHAKAYLESNNIKFAPLNIAAKFAVEHPTELNDRNTYDCFGFHNTKLPFFKN